MTIRFLWICRLQETTATENFVFVETAEKKDWRKLALSNKL